MGSNPTRLTIKEYNKVDKKISKEDLELALAFLKGHLENERSQLGPIVLNHPHKLDSKGLPIIEDDRYGRSEAIKLGLRYIR